MISLKLETRYAQKSVGSAVIAMIATSLYRVYAIVYGRASWNGFYQIAGNQVTAVGTLYVCLAIVNFFSYVRPAAKGREGKSRRDEDHQ